MPKITARRLVLSLTTIVALALAAYAGYWYRTARELAAGLEPWAEAQRAQGDRLHWDRVEIGGFPAEFRFRFANATFAGTRPLSFAAEAPEIEVEARPWNLRQWRFAMPSARLDDSVGTAGCDLNHVEGEVSLAHGAAISVALAAHDIVGRGLAAGWRMASARLHYALPAAPPAGHSDTALSFSLELEQTTLPVFPAALGNTLGEIVLAGEIKGRLPPGPLAPALESWRDDGGTVELHDLRLAWGGLTIAASGTLALDNDLQPIGALSTEITGQDHVVDIAVATGGIKPRDATIAKTVLGLLAKPSPDGEKAISLPLSLQDGRLYLGPATLARLPRIDWQ